MISSVWASGVEAAVDLHDLAAAKSGSALHDDDHDGHDDHDADGCDHCCHLSSHMTGITVAVDVIAKIEHGVIRGRRKHLANDRATAPPTPPPNS